MSSSVPPSEVPVLQDAVQPAAAPRPAGAVRMFGRFQLLRLLGKSARSMAWVALDTRSQQEFVLTIPRTQPRPEVAAAWMQTLRRAARLSHPHLAPAVEIGEVDRWPFVAYDRSRAATWLERFSAQGLPATDMARWVCQAAQGLAFAHEAGVAHHDIQPWMLLVDDDNKASVMGLEIAGHALTVDDPDATIGSQAGALAMEQLRQTREAAVNDVLGLGLVLHRGLAGQAPLDEPDVLKAIERMPPQGGEIVRLPWNLPRPVPDALRAIANRATDRQERQRYRNARTLERALEGWLATTSDDSAGPLSLLLDRMRTAGVLPAQPGAAQRVAHLALMDKSRTNELAAEVLQDMALTFELLRLVNSAKVHGEPVSADGPVLMLRRAIAMLGLDGVRNAALGLRNWPGPMNPEAAAEMEALIARVQRAGRVAMLLVPAGYDGEVIYLITLLQNLGRLVTQYHFPEESAQIRRLMQSGEKREPGAPEEPGMSAEAASCAVLGLDLEDLGTAVARHWGLADSVLKMIRRVAPDAPVRHPEGDDDMLRLTASCANELLDASSLPARRLAAGMGLVAQRYARVLGVTGRDMQDALQQAGQPVAATPAGARAQAAASAAAASRPAGPGAAPGAAGSPRPVSSLRAKAAAEGRPAPPR